MTLSERIDAEIKQAMKERQAEKLSTLRMLKAAVKHAAIEKGGASAVLDDEEVVKVVRREVKKRQDSIASYQQGGRPELAAKETAEIAILESYLPAGLSQEQISKLVAESIAEAAKGDATPTMGAVMKIATARAAGRVDGKTLSQAVAVALR